MGDLYSECNCSRFRLGSDGNSSSSGSESADGSLDDHWLLRVEVDCEWPQLDREIQV